MNSNSFDYTIVANPEIFAQGRCPAHSDHEYYRKIPGDCRLLLNGQWKFSYAQNYSQAV